MPQREPFASLTSLTEVNLERLLTASSIPVLINFPAPWSKMMDAALARLANAFAGDLRVLRVNLAGHPELAVRFKIRVVPTLLIFDGGVPVEFIVGIVPERYIFDTIRKTLSGATETHKAGETYPAG
jgi:thioredoxin 1